MERLKGDQFDPDGARDDSVEQTLRVLRRRWLLIVGSMVIVGLAGFGYSKLQTRQFTASVQVLFGNTDLSNSGQQASGLGVPVPVDPQRQSANIVLLMTSGNTAALTAHAIGGGLTPAAVSSSVTVAPQGQSNIVTVSATSTSASLAARIATTYANQFISSRRAGDRASLRQAQRLVQHQLALLPPVQRAGLQGQTLADRVESLKIQQSIDNGNVRLLGAAGVPTSPSSSSTAQNVEVGALVGLLLGLALAFLLQRLNRRLTDVDELEQAFGFPIVGHIPEDRVFAEPVDGTEPVALSDHMEAFRMLRAHLRYFNVDRSIKTILVTSIESGDGKTTIACNLAQAAASMGARTLLIEADLRRPSIASQFRVRPAPGLSEVLITQATTVEAIQEVPVISRLNGKRRETALDLLVAGAVPPNPGELLESVQMETLITWAAENHELVLVDAPPLSVVSDAIPLLQKIDGVLVVGRLEKNTRDAARRFKEKLDNLGAPVLGVVVNAIKARAGGYGYGYYGYYPSTKPAADRGASNGTAVPVVDETPAEPERSLDSRS